MESSLGYGHRAAKGRGPRPNAQPHRWCGGGRSGNACPAPPPPAGQGETREQQTAKASAKGRGMRRERGNWRRRGGRGGVKATALPCSSPRGAAPGHPDGDAQAQGGQGGARGLWREVLWRKQKPSTGPSRTLLGHKGLVEGPVGIQAGKYMQKLSFDLCIPEDSCLHIPSPGKCQIPPQKIEPACIILLK